MCFAQFKILNLATEEQSLLENKGRIGCARTALLVKAVSHRKACNLDEVTDADMSAALGSVNIGAFCARLDNFVVALPAFCPLLLEKPTTPDF